ncbi:hypothetical protein [Aeromonas bivalvium]|uniref:hypothetical protein n=1 Tax=Aeromonas bivalvium TaxID=440079 RepID=UPI0038D0E958
MDDHGTSPADTGLIIASRGEDGLDVARGGPEKNRPEKQKGAIGSQSGIQMLLVMVLVARHGHILCRARMTGKASTVSPVMFLLVLSPHSAHKGSWLTPLARQDAIAAPGCDETDILVATEIGIVKRTPVRRIP